MQGGTPDPTPPNLGFTVPDSAENLTGAVRFVLALNRLRKAAEEGDAEAQYELGLMYEGGEGVPKEYFEAAYWLQKAADPGFAKAEGALAMINRDAVVPSQPGERSRRKTH